MANISTYLQAIMSARYGKDVRQSIHDGIKAINDEVAADKNEVIASKEAAENAATAASTSAQEASASESAAKKSETAAAASASAASTSAQKASASESAAKKSETAAAASASAASTSAQKASASESAAKKSETAAAASASAASTSAQKASASESAAKKSETAAAASASAASTSAQEASASESAAKKSETAAAASESAASTSAQKASASESAAKKSETAAAGSESAASTSAQTAIDKATLAKSYAVGGTGTRAGEDTDNAKYYMQQAEKQTGGIPTKLSQLENDAGLIAEDGDGSGLTVGFTEAAERENIVSGENTGTLMGKIKKWLADLAAAAFMQVITSYADLMAGTALDNYLIGAAAAKEGFTDVNSKLESKVSTINDSVIIKKEVAADSYAYGKANFIATLPAGSLNRAGYGFHNEGQCGAFLYLEPSDQKLHLIMNDGRAYIVETTPAS